MRVTRFDPVSFSLGKEEGGGGTTDYDALSNKPSIGGVTLTGDKTAADLGLATVSELPTQVSDLTNDSGFQDAQQVEDKIDAKISSAYKAGGSATIATLPPLTAAKLGVVVNMSGDFTTTADFLEGAGKEYPAGTNVVVAEVSANVYKYDVLAGFVDLSGYVKDTRKVGGVPLSSDIPVSVTGDTAITVTNTGTASAIGYSIALKDSGVTAGSKGDTTNQTPGFGGTFKVLSATVDAKGRLSALAEHSVEVPDTEATQSAKGLMSAEDKAKLDTLVDATLSNSGQAADAKATGDAISRLDELADSIPRDIVVTLTPTQSGSGDPSPDNVRPISGATSVSVTRTGENGANAQTVTVQLTDGSNPLTVYGGTLNVTTGELTVTHKLRQTLPATGWTKDGKRRFCHSGILPGIKKINTGTVVPAICSHYERSTPDASFRAKEGNLFASNHLNNGWLFVVDNRFSEPSDFMAWLAENETPIQVCYELESPVTYNLTPAQLAALPTDTVTSDAGTVSLSVRAVPIPATAAPLMDGTAAAGMSAKYAREDHRHPTDTSRASAADVTALQAQCALMRELIDGIDAPIYRTASGNPATFEDGYDAANVKKLTVTITPTQSGSGDPSPSNVRPISGVSSVSVTRTGENVKNLWGGEKMLSDIQSAAPNATVSGTTINFSAASVSNKRLDSVSFRENTRYTFILNYESLDAATPPYLNLSFKYTDGTDYKPIGTETSGTFVYVSEANKTLSGLYGYWYQGRTVIDAALSGAFEGVLSADEFQPYQGASVAVSLPLTVYGGTLNITTGELNVTYRILAESDFIQSGGASAGGLYRFQGALSAPYLCDMSRNASLLSNMIRTLTNGDTAWYSSESSVILDNAAQIRIYDDSVDNDADFQAKYAGLQVLYPLATPLTYQLTPAQLATLSGYNAVSTDANTLSVTYRADPALSL